MVINSIEPTEIGGRRDRALQRAHWICSKNIDRVEPIGKKGRPSPRPGRPAGSPDELPRKLPPLTRGEPGSLLGPSFFDGFCGKDTGDEEKEQKRTRVPEYPLFSWPPYLLICVSWWENAFPTTKRTLKAPSCYHGYSKYVKEIRVDRRRRLSVDHDARGARWAPRCAAALSMRAAPQPRD